MVPAAPAAPSGRGVSTAHTGVTPPICPPLGWRYGCGCSCAGSCAPPWSAVGGPSPSRCTVLRQVAALPRPLSGSGTCGRGGRVRAAQRAGLRHGADRRRSRPSPRPEGACPSPIGRRPLATIDTPMFLGHWSGHRSGEFWHLIAEGSTTVEAGSEVDVSQPVGSDGSAELAARSPGTSGHNDRPGFLRRHSV